MSSELILIYGGFHYKVFAIKELADAISNKSDTLLDKQMTRLIKEIGDTGRIRNPEKFKKPKISKCKKIWEFKPDAQIRYFAVIDNGMVMIFDKERKKKPSLKQDEYNMICQRAKKMGFEE